MLREISIKNFAIIEEITLSFEQGMTILTGETGAGKSIIIDAMTLLLGGRASSDFVRHGSHKAQIEGLFDGGERSELMTKLEELGLEATSELILRRDISADGKSSARINGQLVTVSALREIGSFLIDIHGQHDNQELMDAKNHLRLLDEFGESIFESLKTRYQSVFEDFRQLRAQLTHSKEKAQSSAERLDVLQFHIQEIEAADLNLSTDEELPARRNKLLHAKTIADALNTALLALDNEDDLSGLSVVATAMNHLESVADLDANYAALAEKTTEAYDTLSDVAASLEGVLSELEFDASELTALEERIWTLTTLKKKFGPELTDVLAYYESAKQELEEAADTDTDLSALTAQLKDKQKELIEVATALTEARQALAQGLETDIKQELTDLYMEKADFQVRFTPAKFSIQGNQHVEFYIETNPGEGFKPLAKTVSGGELSRLMLAIKSSFARRENKTSIVFDEVDTGVSGRVAQAIAQKIYKIASSGQVLAISHLPQVVAIADTQFYIEKSSTNNVTTSTVRKLAAPERIEEVAKMLAGEHITKEARAQAARLLLK